MPTARAKQVDYNTTPYYHCFVRCVRKGYLFGRNEKNEDVSHRKEWIVARLKQLSENFAIQICAYAVMTNHYHVVLHVNVEQAKSWTDDEVVARWRSITGGKIEPKYEQIQQWRDNLSNLSWFMRFMNEYIARKANQEDDVKGRFWEGRFKSQALIKEGALLACMAYVDLNPIRANMSTTLENSEHTSIQERLANYQTESLMSFAPSPSEKKNNQSYLPFTLEEYVNLVNWTGCQIRDDKPGYLSSSVPSLVKKVGLNPSQWVKNATNSRRKAPSIIGSLSNLQQWANKIGLKWIKGQSLAKLNYINVN